ncbi:hypothetical protein RHSIM_Rhsim10G0053200 [Rhododendron simsii]|uniref:Protein kinase domain-containing protein n=1 Tax=Rhododendron simsii TaxID=118357 RepID=A0A834GGG1_RHOSS|nr:hypothetical protein RHSIM_Rhsim10G0053200 [Rhododendron simsii]
MTNNFDDELVIGSGGFGNIYKGFIDDGTTIFALKMKSKSNQGADEFRTEIEMLSNLRHMHLVNLIGYCDERKEMILVYQCTVNRTLADHLYKHYPFGNGTICHLSWMQTMKICIRAARGLDYLHTNIRRCIICRDVKTTNILLNKDWVAKISNFGLCKVGTTSHSHTHVSTAVKGTFGYLDLEYFLTRRLTKKSDVYAFGVMLLEVLCGRPIVDLRLEEEQHKVANKCLHKHPSGRPTMIDVMAILECMLASQEQPRNACTEEEEVNVHGDFNQEIYDDKNTPENDILSEGISPTANSAPSSDESISAWGDTDMSYLDE